ncbi:MAG: winged helix-turn-helix transcriptional regulator [Acidimicrobiia bacterium]
MTNPSPEFPHNAYCPYFQETIELIGRRWTATILRALFAGNERFTDIAKTVPGLSHRLLSERLEELQRAGLVTIEPGIKHGTYRLTDKGHDLRRIFAELEDWNARWYEAEEQETQPIEAAP